MALGSRVVAGQADPSYRVLSLQATRQLLGMLVGIT